MSLQTILSLLESNQGDVEVTSIALLELGEVKAGNVYSPQRNTSPDISVADCSFLAKRFEIIKLLNQDFKQSIELINFSESEKSYSISHMVGSCRKYLLHITKTELFSQVSCFTFCIIDTIIVVLCR